MGDNGGARRRAGRRSLWICAGIAAVGAVAAVLGIWHLPDRMYPGSGTEVVQAQAALQGGLLTAAAALTAVAGGLIALDETRQANTETRRANEAADTRERAANANTHVRELYIAAIGLLSAETIDGRLGGIYALERVARDSADDQRTVVEVLSAFVREHTRPPTDAGPPVTDVQAALTVLGRLPARDGVPRADLTGASLIGAQTEGANLAGALLIHTDLTNARLVRASLVGAQMEGANLAGAQLAGVDLTDAWLEGANLTGVQLAGAVLTRAWLDRVTLTGARLIQADLTSAWLEGTNFTGALLIHTDLTDAELQGATFTRARLDRANLTGARGLTAEQVAAAFGDARTRLPDSVERPGSWPPYNPSAGPPAGGS